MDSQVYRTTSGGKSGRQRFCRSDSGFTLLELLISITLLVTIIALLMGAMRMGSRSLAAGEKKMADQERFRSVLSILDAQIESQIPLTYREDGNTKYYFRGEEKFLRMATNYSIWGAYRGYVIADYRVETDPGNPGKEILIARESVPGIDDHRDIRMLDVSSASFEYYWKDAAQEEGKWVASLVSSDVVPEKIRIRLTRGNKNYSLLFPVRVGGRMLSIQTGGTSEAGASSRSPVGVK